MYAVIETGGKQYRVTEGEVVRVEKLDGEVGSTVSMDAALVASDDAVHVGTPVVEGAAVKATVVELGRGQKVIAFKKKRRKGYRRRVGHRQDFTALKIDEIVLPKKRAAKKKAATEEGEE
jgi:large subunit ribosomal protein L21